MKQFFLSVSLVSLFSLISAFNCPTVTDEVDCTSMTGCIWNPGSSTCAGSFAPTCPVTSCYYVDPANGLDSQTGTAGSPFLTLGPALTALLTKTEGHIYILNPLSSQEAKLLAPATVTAKVAIMPYFTRRKYVLSLTNFVAPSPIQPALSITANNLTIIQALINNKTVQTGITTIFDIVGTSMLNFTNVSVYEYQGSTMLVNIGTTYTGAKFIFQVGKYIGTSFIFNVATGTHTLTNVDFIDVKGSAYIFKVGTTMTLTNIFVKTGAALFLNLSDYTTITATNITFDGYNGNFIRGVYGNKLSLTSSLFKNIVQTSPTPFIYLKNKGTTTINHAISYCTFQDIQVRASLFLMETNAFTTTMTYIIMNNIKKIQLLPHQKTAEDSSYESIWPGGVCFLGRDTIALVISHSVFTNIYSHCVGLTTAALTINNSTFNNSDINPAYESLITSSTTIDSFSESDGVTFINFQDGTSDIIPLGRVAISNSKFISNKIHPKYGGAIRFTGVFASTQISILNSQFIDLGAAYGGAIYLDNPVCIISSEKDIYQDNIAINGGAFYKSATVTDTVQIIASQPMTIISGTFTNNKAFNKGGSIYLDFQTLGLTTSTFENGRAKHGGSIYFRQINYNLAYPNNISNNTFKNNIASLSGGAIKVLFNASELFQGETTLNKFEDCTDYKGLAVSDGKPLYFIFSFYDLLATVKEIPNVDYSQWITNSTLTNLSKTINSTSFPSDFILNHKSGHTLRQIIKVEVYDDRHEIADYIHQEIVSATITDFQNNISKFTSFLASSPVTFSFQRGVFLMKSSITMVGQPQTTATLTLAGDTETSNILSDAYLSMNQDFTVFFTDCDVGDVFDPTTRVCDTCDEGFYSLLNPYQAASCIPCDQNRAFCLGGSQIAPKPGYWRYDISTDNIIECPQTTACLGGWFNESYSAHGECEFPYEGNLCNQCAPNYAKFGSSESCVSCKTDKMYYVKFVGFFAIQIIALLYGIKCNVNKTNHIEGGDTEENKARLANLDNEDFQSNIMKITINFLQISSIVIQYNFDWPVFITNIVNATNKIIPSDKDGFSVDCIVAMITGNNQYINFIKLVITLVQPYIMWSALILVYLFYLKLKKETIKGNPKVKKNVVVLFIITAFILQPNIMQATLEMFRCVNYGSESDPIYFMKEDSEIQCWTYLHVFWSVIIALPNFVLWTIALPLILLKVLRKNAKNLSNPELYAKYSFVYEGLKKDKYYWEFVILTRKSLLIIIFVFLNFISSQSQAFATFLVILTFGAIHYVKWPYDDERLNRAELLSLLTSGIMVYCGMFFLAKGGNDWINTILIIFSAACNLAFYLYIGKNLVQSFRLKALHLTKQAQSVKKKLSEMKEKYKEKKRSNKSGSNTSNFSSSVEEKKNISGIEIKDLSAVLNQIQENTPGLPLSPLERLLNMGNDDNDQDHSSIPTENNENYGRSKTVYNEEKVNNSNHSVFRKSFVLPRQEQKDSFSRADSGLTLMTPEMLNDMLNIFKSRKSSPTQDYNSNNSNDSPFLGRTFTVNEKLYEPQNNMSKDVDEDDS